MKILDFAFTLGKLKTTKRAGWIREKIQDPESISDHSFRTAVLVLILAPKVDVDINKSVKMALIHDIGESIIGDIVTRRGEKVFPNHNDKIREEKDAISQVFGSINQNEYTDLFNEFEEEKTLEAKFVKQIDKLEMAIQAYEYEKQQKIDLQEFFDDANSRINTKELKEIMDKILSFREKNV